jgi:hypothetical protein
MCYDMIYVLTAIGLTPGGSSTVHIYTQTPGGSGTVHIYTQTIHGTTQIIIIIIIMIVIIVIMKIYIYMYVTCFGSLIAAFIASRPMNTVQMCSVLHQ